MSELSPALYRAGTGEPLVLIHGFTATWRCWMPVLAQLVARFEVFAPTLHGHDGGPPLGVDEAPQGYPDAVDRLERQLDDLGLDTAHVAGHSLGGALALELAKRGRARSVVALSPAGGLRADDHQEAERLVRVFTRLQALTRRSLPRLPQIMARPAVRRVALRDVMAHGEQVPADEAIALARSSLRCDVVADAFAALHAGRASLEGLHAIDCPVLIAWAEWDRILPMARHALRLQAEIPGAEFRVLPGVGHLPTWDAPNLVAATIGDFAAAAARAAAAGVRPL